MDTTTPLPPPPPPPAPRPASPPTWWRRPLADLVDLLLLALIAVGVGAVVAGLVMLDASGDDPWAGLAAALLGLGAAGVTAAVVWVVLLVGVHTGRTTPGHRIARVAGGRGALAVAGSHVALVVAGWAFAVAIVSLVEPPPEGLLGGAVGAAVAAAALVLAHGWGARSTRVGIVAGALVVGGLLAGAVPDRAPYAWEARDAVHEAMVVELAVTIDGDPVAILSALNSTCGTSRIVLDRYDTRPNAGRLQSCR